MFVRYLLARRQVRVVRYLVTWIITEAIVRASDSSVWDVAGIAFPDHQVSRRARQMDRDFAVRLVTEIDVGSRQGSIRNLPGALLPDEQVFGVNALWLIAGIGDRYFASTDWVGCTRNRGFLPKCRVLCLRLQWSVPPL